MIKDVQLDVRGPQTFCLRGIKSGKLWLLLKVAVSSLAGLGSGFFGCQRRDGNAGGGGAKEAAASPTGEWL